MSIINNTGSILQQLQDVNLTVPEAEIYVALLQLGEVSIVELAKHVKVKRPSIYNQLLSLEKKELVAWVNSPRGKKVIALNPEKLLSQTTETQQRLQSMNTTIQNLIPQLNVLKKQTDFFTEIKYYQGESGIRQMIQNSLSAHKSLYGYSAYGRSEVVGADFMKIFRKEWVSKKIRDNVIINDDKIATKLPKVVMVPEYLKYQEIRTLPKEKFHISSDIMIYNNVYAVASLDPKNPMGVEVYNEEIVRTQMSIFNILWDLAEPTEWEK